MTRRPARSPGRLAYVLVGALGSGAAAVGVWLGYLLTNR